VDVVLQTNQLLKYPRRRRDDPPPVESIDGLPNFFYWTHTDDGHGQAQLESGFNQMVEVKSPSGKRRPAVLIRTSSDKAGSSTTPWHDHYDMDAGRVRYFGDAKAQHMPNPHDVEGNKVMRKLFEQHTSPKRADRVNAAPLLFFVSPRKGEVEFRGVGLVEAVELVSQVDNKGQAFSNYVFDCALISLAAEGERLNWEWISKRKDPELTDDDVLAFAPAAWQTWAAEGTDSLTRVRRVVARLGVMKKEDQLPPPGSPEEAVLKEVYDFYSDEGLKRKKRFEALAEVVTDFVISQSHGRYKRGWVTRGSGDHGIDFVGRLDVGSGFSTTSLVVLGQAKCESPDSATSGKDIARTVARLRRGWIGCYVTTGTFSPNNQQEVVEDRYPLILVPGAKVAEAVRTITIRDGISVQEFLRRIDATYEERLRDRDPEQVLVL
jgi:hypothetical protein